jgi:hypothetical protein
MMHFSNLRWHRGIPSSADTYLCLQGIFLLEFQYIYLLKKISRGNEDLVIWPKGFSLRGNIRAYKNREGIKR